MSRINSVYQPKGHLTIYKRYEGREDELVFDEDNIVTSGLAAGLSYLFSLSGASSITDFQIRFFQLGVSGDLNNFGTSTLELVEELAGSSDYQGTGSKLTVVEHNHWKNGVLANEAFAEIPFYSIQKASTTSVKFVIIVDKNSCNDLTFADGTVKPLNEIGMYMTNPPGLEPKASILVAYRPFTNIIKTDDFGLVFKWVISF